MNEERDPWHDRFDDEDAAAAAGPEEKPIDLAAKFPDLRPTSSPPSLWTVNGCGTAMYGRRDYDEETDTYVKTQCVCFLFIPLIALKSYRVADSGKGGWYFIGREPLSAFARGWSIFLVCSVLAGLGIGAWYAHTQSADYIAGQKLEEAAELAEAGRLADAGRLYRDVALGDSARNDDAHRSLEQLFGGPIEQAPPAEAKALLNIGIETSERGRPIAGLFEKGIALAEKHAKSDPRAALAIVQTVEPLDPGNAAIIKTRARVLEPLATAEPNNVEVVSQLAEIRFTQNRLEEARKLLEPLKDRLALSDGAMVLGRIYAREGRLDDAETLLAPWIESRMTALRAAEEAQQQAIERLKRQIDDDLRNQRPEELFDRLRGMNEQQQREAVQQYIVSRFTSDAEIARAQREMMRHQRVVPVALDLGMTLLRRSQQQGDPQARRRDLERAEKTFLSVRGLAGESDAYRLYLGEVYYWLGRQTDGRKLFDELLNSRGRGYQALMMLATTLRRLGEESETRKLAEEAYKSASNENERSSAAHLRAVTNIDIDDKIEWLRRIDQSDPAFQAELETALGTKAFSAGNYSEAEQRFREAAELYAGLPENPTTLNNGAIAWLQIFYVTGDRQAFEKTRLMVEKSLRLQPDDSILVSNAARYSLDAAVLDLVGGSLDLKALKRGGDLDLLGFLYADASGRDEYAKRLRGHPEFARSMQRLERAVLLAPKRPGNYRLIVSARLFTRDLADLPELLERITSAEPDTTAENQQTLDRYLGKDLEKLKREARDSVIRSRRIVEDVAARSDATAAVARAQLVDALIESAALGEAVDADEVVQLAEAAHAAAPSAATHSRLLSALAFRAVRQLAETNKQFHVLTERVRLSVGPRNLLAAVLSDPGQGELRDQVSEHPDVQRLLKLIVESGERFPDDRSPQEWALLRTTVPEQAQAVAKVVRKDDSARTARQIALKLAPLNTGAALSEYWALQIEGKDADAKKVLKPLADKGVPLPIVP